MALVEEPGAYLVKGDVRAWNLSAVGDDGNDNLVRKPWDGQRTPRNR